MIAPKSSRVALVTGASSGIGEAFARRLARDGWDLVLVARRVERLERLANAVRAENHVNAHVFEADLARSEDVAAVERLITDGRSIQMLVNNAGVGGIATFSEAPPADIRHMLDVNVVAVTRLTRAALPSMLKQRSGTIVNVGSGLAFAPMAGTVVYSASKAFLVQFTQALRVEVEEPEIRLQALIPGLIRTEFGDSIDAAFYDRFPAELVMSADDLVDVSLVGLAIGEVVCIPGLADYGEWLAADTAMQRIGEGVSNRQAAKRYLEE